MSSLSYAATDSATMLRRNLRHALRYPSMTISTVAMPVAFLLLFNYVFGGTLGAGIRGVAHDGGHYIDFLAPGVLVMTAAAASVSTAVSVSVDMTEGIVNRFRTMAISRGSLLTGHVVGSLIQTMLGMALVAAVALLVGFRPRRGPPGGQPRPACWRCSPSRSPGWRSRSAWSPAHRRPPATCRCR